MFELETSHLNIKIVKPDISVWTWNLSFDVCVSLMWYLSLI